MIYDDTLLDIMSEAAKGTGVLVLVYDIALVPVHVIRSKELLINGLKNYGEYSDRAARAFILSNPNDWKITLQSGGWVLFYPAIDVKAASDFGKPKYVYLHNQRGRYERMTYGEWWITVAPPPDGEFEDPVEEEEPPPKSTWEQLLEDD